MLTVPITLLLICFGYFAIVLLFQRGQFSAESTWLTYEVLLYLALSITVYAIRDLLIRVFYALGDSRTPFLSSFVTIFTMFGASWLLAPGMGVSGIALASSLAAGMNFLVLALLLHWRIGPWIQRESWWHGLKVGVAAVPMALLGAYTFDMLRQQPLGPGMFLQSLFYSSLLGINYLAFLVLLRDREVLALGRMVMRRFRR
jgi:putative peptidoglycan lipid II flippase